MNATDITCNVNGASKSASIAGGLMRVNHAQRHSRLLAWNWPARDSLQRSGNLLNHLQSWTTKTLLMRKVHLWPPAKFRPTLKHIGSISSGSTWAFSVDVLGVIATPVRKEERSRTERDSRRERADCRSRLWGQIPANYPYQQLDTKTMRWANWGSTLPLQADISYHYR